jgi:superfamily I DNA/RNA helicase
MSVMHPTDEQLRIKAAFDVYPGLLLICAGAGTGKTTTLRYITDGDSRHGLYLAFNTRIAKEAAQSFGSRVECRTIHSLAYRAMDVARRYREKLGGRIYSWQLAQWLGIDTTYRDISPQHIAAMAREAVRRYQQSSDDCLEAQHCWDGLKDFQYFKRWHLESKTPDTFIDQYARSDHEDYRAMILKYALRLWEKRMDPCDPMPIDHDTYLKLWALEKPTVDYDYILLDEGQDTNDVVLDLFLRQPAQRVIVGDEYQAIYGWRGATNALAQCRDQADGVLTLTQSFRYGEAIAEVANEILSINPECDFELRGWPERNSTLGDVNGRHTVIARSNAVLVEKALRCIREGKTISVVGGIRDACDQIESIYWLREGELERVNHPDIKPFRDFEECLFEAGRDQNLKRYIKFIDEEGDLLATLELLRRADNARQESAEIILTTAHKSKGLEFGQVALCDDFREPQEEDGQRYLAQEEVNVLYVAATRTLNRLQPNKLVSKLMRMGTATIDHKRTSMWARDKHNMPTVLPAVTPLAVAWRYRMADNYGGGTVVSKAGPIGRTQVEASLKERFGCEVIELKPCS